jgi:N-acetylglucosamine-6-phosphate deacetylase
MHSHDGEPRSGDGRVVLAGARVVTPAGTLPSGWVAVQGGLIAAVGPGLPATDAAVGPGPSTMEGALGADLPAGGGGGGHAQPAGGTPVHDLGGAWLVPGFVDMHVHGGGGAWLSSADPQEVGRALRFHLGQGTTSMLASIATSPLDSMLASAAVVAGAAAGPLAPALAGIHLEGPFISRERSGAQDPDAIRDPDPAAMERLLEACRGWARMVTVAPERPGGLELVRLVFQAAGARRVALVTDAIAAAGMADGDYRFGRVPLRVRGGVARLVNGRTIAGSTLTMDAALRRAVQEVGIRMEDAVAAASSTPARAIGAGERTGSIEQGKAADLVVLDDDLEVVAVMAAGRWVHRRGQTERLRAGTRTSAARAARPSGAGSQPA